MSKKCSIWVDGDNNYLYNVNTNYLQVQLFKGTTLLETILVTDTTGFNMTIAQTTNFNGFVVIKYKLENNKPILYVHTYKDGLLVSMKTVDFTGISSQISTVFYATDKYIFNYYSSYFYIFDYNGNQIYKSYSSIGEITGAIPVDKNMYLLYRGSSAVPYFLSIDNGNFTFLRGSSYSTTYSAVITNLYTKLLTGRV